MLKSHTLNIFIILIAIIIAWNKILSQAFLGEGFFYFFHGFWENSNIFRYDIGASILMDFIKPIFKDNFFLYQSLALLTFSLLGVLFYLVIYEITQKKEISLVSAILFGVNYTTSFEMLAIGAYQNFGQRIFFALLLFFSFLLLLKFKKNKKKIYYILSLLLCTLSVFLAYFNLFFIIFIPAYLLATLIVKPSSRKKFLYELLLIAPFILLSLVVTGYIPIFIKQSSIVGDQNLLPYLFSHADLVLFHSLRQLVFLTIPEIFLTNWFGSIGPLYQQQMKALFIPIVLLYVCLTVFLFIKERKLRTLLIASLIFLQISFVLNMYARGDNVDHLGPGSRYLFTPSIGFSIFWAIFFVYIAKQFNKNLIYILITSWFVIQIISINYAMDKEKSNHIATKKITTYIKNISPKLKKDSIVVVPRLMGSYGAGFCQLFYGKSETHFLSFWDQIEWTNQFKRPFDPKKDIILSYDNEKQVVVDRTKEYKSIIVQKKIK